MTDYQLVVDTWESGGEIDEQVYKDNNIAALIIRLNDMNGGHHMDTGFVKQWTEAEGFLRAPYFVYNPWVKGQANFDWLVSHCPDDANTVLVDIEVSMPDYSTSAYAAQVDYFMDLVKERWGTKTIYTGEWFLDRLEFWPTDADYWWAQYPYALYPDKTTYVLWDAVREIIDDNNFREPFNVEKIPGTYKMWQCTGDRLVCPGNDRVIDISIFPGTHKELAAFLGYQEVEPPTDPPPVDPPPTEPPGEDMEIPEAILEAGKLIHDAGMRIADVIEGLVITGPQPPTDPPTDPPPVDPPAPEFPKRWQLINPQKSGNVPFFRNPDVNTNKIGIWKENVVKEYMPPERFYNDAADLFNLMKDWAWIKSSVVYNAGGKAKMMPRDFETTTGKSTDNWFGGGFVERNRLQKA